MSGGLSARTERSSGRARGARLGERVDELLALRTDASERFFAEVADPLARLCHRVAERFARGGRLLAVGHAPQARSDAHHVAVEFVHPGDRRQAGAACAGADGRRRDAARARRADSRAGRYRDRLRARRGERRGARRGRPARLPDVAFEPIGAEWELTPAVGDPFVRQELTETAYHVLWELVHVFFEHRGLLAGRDAAPVHDVGASSFLYPFLAEGESDLEGVLEDVRHSIVLKARETALLRAQTLGDGRDTMIAAASELRARLDAGGTLFALGNGGSATDAMDVVADLREPPGELPARRAIDLTEDTAILTAIANDIGVEAIFRRQLIAQAAPATPCSRSPPAVARSM